MSFWDEQSNYQKKLYEDRLDSTIRLNQKMMTDSEDAYVYYRNMEYVFINVFDAEDCSREDISVDCIKHNKNENVGMALKTFLNFKNGISKSEKIAEFDKDMKSFSGTDMSIVNQIAILRNKRLDDTRKQKELAEMHYHYVVREGHNISIYEKPIDNIDINNIQLLQKRKGSGNKNIPFSDGINKYIYDVAKSTLKMEFQIKDDYKHTFVVGEYFDVKDVLKIVKIYKIYHMIKKYTMGLFRKL